MKRFKSIDIIAFTYCLYFSITLAFEPNMFDKETELYSYFNQINPSEKVWGMAALFISVVYLFSFLFQHHKWISIVASVLSGSFFVVVGSAYMITYPNIGSGIFTIIGVVCFMNVGNIVIDDQTTKEVERLNDTTTRD